jgi:hypothetical protein
MTTNGNAIAEFSHASLQAKSFSPLPSKNLTCPGCQCPIECWEDRNQHRSPFVRKANGLLVPHYLTACKQRIVWSRRINRNDTHD